MKTENGRIIFESADISFLQRFGPVKAVEAFILHQDPTPFLFDTIQLSHLLGVTNRSLWEILRDPDSHYHHFSIKKSGGGFRNISVPDPLLKKIQRNISDKILSCIPVSEYAMAYKKGANLYVNASPHIGKKYLLKMDLYDFFGSVRFDRVYSEAFNRKRYPKQIGTILTTLCCHKDVLPQGAPSSPSISNIIMKHFDDVFGLWCEKHGLSFTRYCDDLTISGNRNLFPAYLKAERILKEMGFVINQNKTRFITNAARQTVTGLTVNIKVSIPSEYKRLLRQQVYYVLKYGIDDCIQKHYLDALLTPICEESDQRINKSSVSITVNKEHYKAVLLGKIGYILSIEPENSYFLTAKDKIRKIE